MVDTEEIKKGFQDELRIKVSRKRLDRLERVTTAVESLSSYFPLTVRQVFYRLVSDEAIPNNLKSYKTVSGDLTQLRLAGIVSWDAIDDRVRRISSKRGWDNMDEYVDSFINSFQPEYYHRCLIQSQPKHVEIWIEKDALSTIVEDVVWPYCLRVVVCRGHSSTTFVRRYAERAKDAMINGKQPVILYMGDLDPSGIECFEATERSLKEKHHIHGVIYKRIALNPEHIGKYSLPHSVDAIKETDPNFKKYVKRFGRIAVELDAVHPGDLQGLVKDAIDAELDLDEMDAQLEIEEFERKKLIVAKHEVKRVLEEVLL